MQVTYSTPFYMSKKGCHSAGAPRIGFAAIPAAQVAKGALIEGWIDMKDEEGNGVGMRGKKVIACVGLVLCLMTFVQRSLRRKTK